MDDSEKSFAYKHGLHLLKKQKKGQKNIVKPVAKQLVPSVLSLKAYKITAENEGQLKQLEKKMEASLKTAVGHSAIIRGLIQLASTNDQVQAQLKFLIDNQRIPMGRPRKKK